MTIFSRVWAMSSKHTFTIKPIKKLLSRYINNNTKICDPFAGFNSPATVTNDLNTNAPTTHHMDALDFLKLQENNYFDVVLYDPPYSFRQVKECYSSMGIDKFDPTQTRGDYWAKVKNECARICKVGGLVLCFGWNSGGLGLNRGCELVEILLVPHGGGKNDTICTVEIRIK